MTDLTEAEWRLIAKRRLEAGDHDGADRAHEAAENARRDAFVDKWQSRWDDDTIDLY